MVIFLSDKWVPSSVGKRDWHQMLKKKFKGNFFLIVKEVEISIYKRHYTIAIMVDKIEIHFMQGLSW